MTTEATDRGAELRLATDNAAALWAALANVRGGTVLRRPGFLAVTAGRAGLRIMLLSPDLTKDELTELTDLARSAAGKVVVEDSFSRVDMSELGLTPRQLPVMIRDRGPALPPATMTVTRVTAADLPTVEHIVVHGFELEDFQPYHQGEAFPPALLDHVDAYLISRDGVPAGACLTVVEHGVGGLYWVTTLPEHRSRGVGRQLMHAVLGHLAGLPVTLTAATAGKPLYDSLGFTVLNRATWWM